MARGHRRRGSVYLLVLGLGLILTVIGVTVVAVGRVSARSMNESRDWAEAQTLAFSAVERGLAQMNAATDWRKTFDGKTTQGNCGRGSVSWRVVDEGDGSLTDGANDPCTVYATGTVGRAVCALQVHMAMVAGPLPSLKTALTAKGGVTITSGDTLTLVGGGLASNGTVTVTKNAKIAGDVQAKILSLNSRATLTGTRNVPGPTMTMPDSGVFAFYKNLATPVGPTSSWWWWQAYMTNVNLNPTSNPQGAANVDGVYYIDSGGVDLYLDHCNFQGTLVVDCAPGTLYLGAGTKIDNYRADYPALIVNGDTVMNFATEGQPRPWGPQRRGGGFCHNRHYWSWFSFLWYWSDPGEVLGLVHVIGDLTMQQSSGVDGCVIVEGAVSCQGNNEIDADPDLYLFPPVGYCNGPPKPGPDAWNRVAQ
jgi:hypothetical protein